MSVYFEKSSFRTAERCNTQHKWHPSDAEKDYRSGPDQPYGPDDITYGYNELGFRCDPFTDADNHAHRIMFVGCSFTEGIGLPREHTWAYQLLQIISREIGKPMPYWNLAVAATGIESIARRTFVMAPILRPQIILAVFPGYRREWKDNNGKWDTLIPTWRDKLFIDNPWLTEPTVVEYETEKNMAMIDLVAEKHDSLLIWDTWIDVFPAVDTALLPRFANGGKCWQAAMSSGPVDHARDGLHPGPAVNLRFAEAIWSTYGNAMLSALT